MGMYYDRQGNPIEDVLEWAKKFENDDRIVAKKNMWFGLVHVSTVWMGMDHDFTYMTKNPNKANPMPLQFETMVFVYRRGEVDMGRWRSEQAAILGHQHFVRRYRNPITMIKTLLGK